MTRKTKTKWMQEHIDAGVADRADWDSETMTAPDAVATLRERSNSTERDVEDAGESSLVDLARETLGLNYDYSIASDGLDAWLAERALH